MPTKSVSRKRTVRRSITLPAEVDQAVQGLARRQKRSANNVLTGLIELGLQAREEEKRRFFETAERFRTAKTASELRQSKEELARMIFGS